MNTKKELAVFFIWFRNGICFAFTWLVFLRLIALKANGIDTISVNRLIEMLLWTAGGVLLFCIAFRKLILRKTGFTARLTFFMVLTAAYEAGYFYHKRLFTGSGYAYEWILFSALIVVMYLICLAIYSVYRKKNGERYTIALQKYQQERKIANE